MAMKTRHVRQGRVESPVNQQGVVLIVGLIMLVVMLLIGITSMRIATMDERISANTMNHGVTFRAAESAVEGVIANEVVLSQARDAGEDTLVTKSVNLNDPAVTSSAGIIYRGYGHAHGSSIGKLGLFRYDIQGTGQIPDLNAATVVTQGIHRIVPAQSSN